MQIDENFLIITQCLNFNIVRVYKYEMSVSLKVIIFGQHVKVTRDDTCTRYFEYAP